MLSRPGARWFSWLVLIISGAGALTALGVSLLLILSGGLQLLDTSIPGANGVSVLNLGWGSALVALLCIPGVVLSILDLRGKPLVERPRPGNLIFASLAALVWIGLVFLFKPLETSPMAWLLLPPLVVLTTVIPLWLYLEIGRRGLSTGSPLRTWGAVSVSLVITLPVLLILELVLMIFILLGVGVYVSFQPDLAVELERYARLLSDFNLNPQILQDVAGELLNRPGVIAIVLAIVAGVIPLLEELFKPLAVWLLAGERLRPAQGFVAGMWSGACFALYENLTALSAAGNGNGTTILLARVGTGLLHIVTAGIVGWGLASAWRDLKKLRRLIFTFLLAVFIHAAWNSAGVLAGISTFLPVPASPALLPNGLNTAAAVIVYVLFTLNLALLFYMNFRLRREEAVQAAAEAAASGLVSAPIPGEDLLK
jgi:hypothetical protein